LFAIYGILALFLGIFAVARLRYERRFPWTAVVGILVCLVALAILIV
jgi:hypothetical protein